MKKYLAEHKINFYIIDATKIAEEIGLGNRTNSIMQSAFFKVSNVIPYDNAVKDMKAIQKTYGRKGEHIVNMNYAAIDRGGELTKVEVPAEWARLEVKPATENHKSDFMRRIFDPVSAMNGDDIPVSAFVGREDGTFPHGMTFNMKNAALRSMYPNGSRQTVSSATNALMFVLTLPSVLSCLTKRESQCSRRNDNPGKAVGKELAGLEFKIQVSALTVPVAATASMFVRLKPRPLNYATWEASCMR